MKKLINFTLIAIASLVVACHKDAAYTVLAPVQFNSTVKASTNMVTLSATTDSTEELTLNWTAAVYPSKLAVKYSIQGDVPSDTATWGNAQTIAVGTNVLTGTLNGATINKWALALGIPGNDTGKMVFRVQAFSDRNAYSKAVLVSVSPFVSTVYVAPPPPASLGFVTLSVPGDYQQWLPQFAPLIALPSAGTYVNNVYEGFIYIPDSAGANYQFKFTSEPDWNGTNYGSTATAGQLSTDGNAGNLGVTGPGFYEVSADLNALTYTATLEQWAIIGDATPNGWGTETPMTYDRAMHAWKVTLDMKTAGSFKFRANDAWNIDFGLDANGRIYFADNPILGGPGCRPNLSNLTVAADGNYTIYLDLSNPNKYYYYLQKH